MSKDIRESIQKMRNLRTKGLMESDMNLGNELTPAENSAEQDEFEKGVPDAVTQVQVKKMGDKVFLRAQVKVGQNEMQVQMDLNNCSLTTNQLILDEQTIKVLNEIKIYYDSWKARWTEMINAQR